MSRAQVVLRAFFYLWFSIVAGLIALGITEVVLEFSYRVSVAALPMSGLPVWLFGSGVILMLLVFGQWEQFGVRVRLLKWIPLCLVTTLLGLVASSIYSLRA